MIFIYALLLSFLTQPNDLFDLSLSTLGMTLLLYVL